MLNWLRRNVFRLAAAVVFALLALGVIPEFWRVDHALLPRLSPLLNLFGALGGRVWAGWSILLGVPLLVLAFFKGRWFCWHLCPMGFLAETAGKANPWGKGLIRRVPAVNKVLAFIIIVTAAFGYPLLIWLDPLCIFNGFFTALRKPLTLLTAATGLGFVCILLASVIAPNIWCMRLCPLGGLQEMIMRIVQWAKSPRRQEPPAPGSLTAPQVARRGFIAAAFSGIAALTARKGFGTMAAQADVIRPPSAVPRDRFNALCARCGNCMKACPYQLIQPDLGASGMDGLFTPVIRFRSRNADQEQYCFQDCTVCSHVCPTGALRPITVEQKHARPIGLARIEREKCIAWKEHGYCVVCDEYCPYKAIRLEKHDGVNCPVVDADKCRGCGACESNCPGDPIAITIHARPVL
jgi:ferredoxin